MSEVPPHRHRGSGDGWVELPDGRRFWGRAGAAGLLAVTPTGAVLLQHRVSWSHFGGTWGLPGGARAVDESAVLGAYREAREETAIDTAVLTPRFASVLELGVWSYTTVAVDAPGPLPVHVADAESTELAWVEADELAERELHPGLDAAWPVHRRRLAERPALVVDAANVVGSRPDGWWHDRLGAAGRLLAGLGALARRGVPGDPELDGDGDPVVTWWPEVVAVLEGRARGASAPDVRAVDAEHDGDARLVAVVHELRSAGRSAWVVTADRALAERVRQLGALVRGPGWLLALLDDAPTDDGSA